RADAHGEQDERDRGEAGQLSEKTHGIAEVLDQVIEPARAAHVPAGFLHLLRPSELEPRLAPRVIRIDAARDQIGGVLLDVEADLPVELALERPSSREASPPGHRILLCRPRPYLWLLHITCRSPRSRVRLRPNAVELQSAGFSASSIL